MCHKKGASLVMASSQTVVGALSSLRFWGQRDCVLID